MIPTAGAVPPPYPYLKTVKPSFNRTAVVGIFQGDRISTVSCSQEWCATGLRPTLPF